MIVQALSFYVFAAVAVVSGVLVVANRNPVYSVLFLILTFFNAAGLFVLLGAEFLAMILVVVYVGAVAVLFLFVVMMLDINLARLRERFWSYLPLVAIVALLLVAEMVIVLRLNFAGFADMPAPPALPADYSNTKELGRVLYTQYAYAFEIAAVLLLVAIIAAIALTLRKRKDSRYQDPSSQVKVRRKDRVRMVQMKPETEK
ncbi:MAG: NADH-quinone oxidoreductase subunit J [Burkholderiales bacterium]